ncbi:MAG: hypothetical protein Q4D80_03540 [Pseudomonadota bacterium]|nr:hypothetical protein [Pseudomonadota bacterium]
MGTFLKYALYLVLLFIVYLVIAGFYDGTITKNSTVGEVSSEVSDNAKRIISNTYNETKSE